MTVYDLKPAFQNLLRPLAVRLVRRGFRANEITLAALLLSLLQAAAILWSGGAPWALALLPLTLFLRMALNALDGIMAREFGQKSTLGAYLNEIGDLLSDTALILAMGALDGLSFPAVLGFALAAILSEYAGVLGWGVAGERRYDGPFGKSDRALFLGLFSLLWLTGSIPPVWANGLFWLGALLGLLTAYNRIRKALRCNR